MASLMAVYILKKKRKKREKKIIVEYWPSFHRFVLGVSEEVVESQAVKWGGEHPYKLVFHFSHLANMGLYTLSNLIDSAQIPIWCREKEVGTRELLCLGYKYYKSAKLS